MNYKLFLDDERHPAEDGWVVARSSKEAIEIVTQRGMPQELALDHDLGFKVWGISGFGQSTEYDTSRTFVRWLIDELDAGRLKLPADFKYSVHSQNPVGSRWLLLTMADIVFQFQPV
ncbi:hypothetical protein [Ralstonia phage phiRSL1]|uniref:Cyclic-phosphate processing Receiver domain-containing protein n=1 Tax=Ralstonia phage phiRSL1 TaxID=1980924 RepID=B2ZXQ8_9CAUD|nr:hypothetical protein RSL1_ORF044 [Ralstonia phage phiRSL1]BAG41489.1 hypothetical protein [Ralstonia phage phiRSL1]